MSRGGSLDCDTNDNWDFASVNSSSNILMDTSETNCRVSGSESASKKPPSCKAYATDAEPFSFKTESVSLPPKDGQYVYIPPTHHRYQR